MITLTLAIPVQSVLGDNVPVNYDKLVVADVKYDILAKTIIGKLRLTSTSATQMEPIDGQLIIRHGSAELIVNFDRGVQFNRRLVLNAGQVTAIQNLLNEAQADIENGLVTLGVVAGTRSAGT